MFVADRSATPSLWIMSNDKKPRPLSSESLARVRGGTLEPVGQPEYKYVPVRR